MDVLDTKRIFLFGRSIGGAVAIATAAGPKADNLAGIVVENTFTSIDNMIDVVLPPLKIFKFLNRNPWNSLTEISSVETPILFISGLRDELVPPAHMKTLYEAATKSRKKLFVTVANGTHNDTWFRGGHAYREAIRNFVCDISQSCLPKGDVARPSKEQCQ
jgi:abhydrolase domain-containing protein 13